MQSARLSLDELLARLIQINSINPNYADGVPELGCASFLHDYLQQQGLSVWYQQVFPDRPNVLARLPGLDRTRQLVFEAHMDTVTAQGMSIAPFEPRVIEGKMFGRGACDTKAGLAAMIDALTELAQKKIKPPQDILLAATIDEEFSYRGVLALCSHHGDKLVWQSSTGSALQTQLAVVAEPTSLRLVTASKGVLRWQIETIGLAAHSSKPNLGRNAINDMAVLITELQRDSASLGTMVHPLLGSPSLNVGVIRGGVQVNFVPDRCCIELDRRLLPGEDWQKVWNYYQVLTERLMVDHPGMRVVMHPPMLTDLPLDCPTDCPQVHQLVKILGQMDLPNQPEGVPFGSDASKFAVRGIPSVIFGPGSIDQAHAAVEYVELQQVAVASDFYRRVMLAEFRSQP